MNEKPQTSAVLTALAGTVAILAGEIAAKGGFDSANTLKRLKQLQVDIERLHGGPERVVELAFEMICKEIETKGSARE